MLATIELLEQRRHLAAGFLDQSWGDGGAVTLRTLKFGGYNAIAPGVPRGIPADSTGGIAVPGLPRTPRPPGVAIARLDAGGAYADHFGAAGVARVSSADLGDFMVEAADGSRFLPTVLRYQPTGVAGTDHARVVLVNSDGIVDSTFGGDGSLEIPFRALDGSLRTALQVDGSLLAASSAVDTGNVEVRRYTRAGELDDSFGSDGIAMIPGDATIGIVNGLAIDGEGRILVSLRHRDGQTVRILRFTSGGQPDANFGERGALVSGATRSALDAHGLVTHPNGDVSILIRGRDRASNTSKTVPVQYIARFNSGGTPIDRADVEGSPTVMALTPQGHYLLLNTDGAARYNSDGSLDRSYGRFGFVSFLDFAESGIQQLTVLPDGGIVVGTSLSVAPGEAAPVRLLKIAGGEGRNTTPGSAQLSNSVLTVRGTEEDDIIDVRLRTSDNRLVVRANTFIRAFPASEVARIEIDGGAGDDDMRNVTAVSSLLLGGLGNDTLIASGGRDSLLGGAGNDLLQGGYGDDFIDAGDGNDDADGDNGDPSVGGFVDLADGSDTMIGGTGRDTMRGNGGSDRVEGAGGNDSLNGGAGADRLYGQNGNDTLNGGGGDDLLFGGAISVDTIIGGAGDNDRAADDDKDIYSAVEVLLT